MEAGQQRVLADLGEDFVSLQRSVDKLQMASWVRALAPWQVIAHLTFRWEVSLWAARRGYERYMRKSLPRVSYFYAEECNPSRDGYHVHALWSDCRAVFRREAWAAWFKRFGRARIEPVRNEGDVSDYCAKYVTKEGAWWDCKLQWHRLEAMHGRPFKLEVQRVGERDQVELERDRGAAPAFVKSEREFEFASDVFNLYRERPGECVWRPTEDGRWERVC